MNTPLQIERTKMPTLANGRISALLALTAMLLGLSACAGIERAPRTEARPTRASFAEQPIPHATLEAAAHAALADAWAGTVQYNRDRLRVGAIVGTQGEFIWLEPQSSKAGFRPSVRLGLHANHAALYIVHPRIGSTEVDRVNEQVSSHEKRLVDEVDPLHRPIFVLTPSGRVLVYSHGAEVAELASVRDRNRERFAHESNEERTAGLAQRR